MEFARTHLSGNPYLGLFAANNDDVVVVPPGSPRDTIDEIASTLNVKSIETTVAGTDMIGMLVVMNSQGILLPGDATSREMDILSTQSNLQVGKLDTRFNALGNLILTNDKGAIVADVYLRKELEVISDILGVKVKNGSIDNLHIVGSLACPNNIGALVSPKTADSEIDLINDMLKVEVGKGTANFGVGNVGTCILANSKGVVAGRPTTGIEMGKMQQVFEGETW